MTDLKKRVNESLLRSKTIKKKDVTDNTIGDSFGGIQKLNKISEDMAAKNFENVVRNPEEAQYYVKNDIIPKNFE